MQFLHLSPSHPKRSAASRRSAIPRAGEEARRDRADNFELTVEFHRAIRQLPDQQRPGLAAQRATIQLREQLIREETKEAIEALEQLRHANTPTRPDLVEHVAKELADVLCVTYGAAAALGIPMDEVYRAVHASNMTKVGGPVRDDGEMLKGSGYRPPTCPGSWVRSDALSAR
jgi:predicted HAD superfamily Cof-like phosphohydrolase